MDIRFQNLGPEKWKADALLAPVTEDCDILHDNPELDKVAPWLAIAPARRDFTAKKGESAVLYGHPALAVPRIFLIGLGRRADFTADTGKVRGQINGLNPWPCVSVPLGDERLKLLRAVTADAAGSPGTVISADPKGGLIVACGSGSVRILEIQAPGGKRMKPEDYLKGHAIPAGTDLKEDRK